MIHTDIKQAVEDFDKDSIVERLKAWLEHKSILESYGKLWDENIHSSFLAWLLNNPKGDSRLGHFFQNKLVQLLVKRGMDMSLLENDEIIKLLAFSPEHSTCDTEVYTECSISKKNRIDLYVEFALQDSSSSTNPNKLRIILENKIDADEHQDQTERYFTCFEEHYKEGDINLYVYLSPKLYVKGADTPCTCKGYIQLSYQDILDHLLLPSKNYDVDASIKLLIEDYINVLNTPSQTKKHPVLAITQENKKLLQDFWEKYHKVILPALEVIANKEGNFDEEEQENKKLLQDFWEEYHKVILPALEVIANKEGILDEEERQKVKGQVISLQNKDHSKYQINLAPNNSYDKSNLPYQVIRVAKKYGLTAQELKGLQFSLRKEKVTLLNTATNRISGGIKRAKSITIDGIRFYISNQWRGSQWRSNQSEPNCIDNFINAINATKSGAFADITISKVD